MVNEVLGETGSIRPDFGALVSVLAHSTGSGTAVRWCPGEEMSP